MFIVQKARITTLKNATKSKDVYLTTFAFSVWFLFFILYVNVRHCKAQSNSSTSQYAVTQFGEEKGLEYKKVSSFVIDKYGIGWLGNYTGLSVFDGKRVYPIYNYTEKNNPLLNLPVSAILYDSSFNQLILFAKSDIYTNIYTLMIDSLGGKQTATKLLTTIKGYLNDKPILKDNKINFIIDNRIHTIKLKKNSFSKTYVSFRVLSNSLFCMKDEGCFIDNSVKKELYKLRLEADSLYLDFCSTLSDQEYQSLFKTKGFYGKKEGKKYVNSSLLDRKQIENIIKELGLEKEYNDNGNFSFDRWGNIYLYGNLGLQKISYKLPFIKQVSIPHETRAITYNKFNRDLYIATARGVYNYNLLSDRLFDSIASKDANYYCASQTIDDSLFCYFSTFLGAKNIVFINQKTSQISLNPLNINFRIWCVCPIGKSNMAYYGTDKGLYKGGYNNGKFYFQKINLSFQGEINDIINIGNNKLIIAGKKGLYQYNTVSKKEDLIYDDAFFCLYQLNQTIIAGSAKSGALIYNKEMVFQRYINISNGLKSNTIYSITYDEKYKTLWLGTSFGLSVYQLGTNLNKTYLTNDGLLHDELNRLSTFKFIGDSLMIIGGLNGINIIQNRLPFKIPFTNTPTPKVWALEVIYNNQKTQKEWIKHKELKKYTFDKKVNKVIIKMLNATSEYLFTTAYKIDEENEWKYINAGEDIELLSPESGLHQLQLKTLLASGEESEIVTINFEIASEWYKKTWGVILIGFISILILFPFLLIRDYYVRQKSKIQINKNKEKLFSIIAHDLRSPIKTYQGLAEIIGYYIDKKDWEALRQVGENIDKTSHNLDLMIENLLHWSLIEQKELKPIIQLCNVSQISKTIVEMYNPIAAQKGVVILNIIDSQLIIKIDSNLLNLILRNLIDNAIKNAVQGTKIELKIMLLENIFSIQIENRFDEKEYQKTENFTKNINSPNLITGRGIGHKLIVQSLQLLNGEIYATISKNKVNLNIKIKIRS